MKKEAADDQQLQWLIEDVRRRARHGRAVKRINDVVSNLMVKRGYGAEQANRLLAGAWAKAAGATLARHSRPGRVRRGVLEVTADSAAVVQELTFQKQQLLKKLQSLAPDLEVRDLRIRT